MDGSGAAAVDDGGSWSRNSTSNRSDYSYVDNPLLQLSVECVGGSSPCSASLECL